MRGGWEVKGGFSVAVYQPYLLDVDKMADRLTRFQSTYQETITLIDGQRWRYRRTGKSARRLVMLPGAQGGGSVFFDVALALGRKLDLITVTAPPIVDAAAMADARAKFLLALVPTPGDTQGLLLAIVENDAPVSEAMPGVLKEFTDLVSREMKIPAKNGKVVPLTSPKGGFAG
jgi:hypothetical protein